MKRIIALFKNTYILTSVCLIVWVLFFDKNDLRTLIKLKREIKQLGEERDYYTAEIAKVAVELKELTTNTKALEKFAREKYLMKRDNEDIFVIVEQKN